MEKTVFLSITDAEKETFIAKAIIAREQELLSYETNIVSYESMIADQAITPEFRKQLSDLLVSENRERDKSLAIYNALKAQIPAAKLAAAITAAKIA